MYVSVRVPESGVRTRTKGYMSPFEFRRWPDRRLSGIVPSMTGGTIRRVLILAALLSPTGAAAREPSRRDLFCPGFIQFIGAAPPERGDRTALFYPMGMSDDAIDMYAPMQPTPHDDAADLFYERVAWLTHYEVYDDFAAALGDCLRARLRFRTTRPPVPKGAYALNAIDRRSGRRIGIEANQQVCPAEVRAQVMRGDDICVQVTIREK